MTAKHKKIFTPGARRALTLWHRVSAAALRDMCMDLSMRQMTILLTVHLQEGPHSIKTLARDLEISKPAICRALDVLESRSLLRRLPDRNDKRNVFLRPTVGGHALLVELAGTIAHAQKRAT